MAEQICSVNLKALLSIAKRILQYSEKIDSYSFHIKTVHETFQRMLIEGNPYDRFEETLCIRFVDIHTDSKVTRIHIEIIVNPN